MKLMTKKQAGIIVRLCIILLPIILSFFFLFTPFEQIELTRENVTGNATIKVTSSEVFEPTASNIIKDVLQVPLNLKWYDICFIDNGTRNVYGNEEFEDYNVNVSVNFNEDQRFLDLPKGEIRCVPYQFDKDFTFDWIFHTRINTDTVSKVKPTRVPINATNYYDISHVEVDFNVHSFARPEIKSIIAKNILLLISWSGIVWLFTRIRKFILEGWNC